MNAGAVKHSRGLLKRDLRGLHRGRAIDTLAVQEPNAGLPLNPIIFPIVVLAVVALAVAIFVVQRRRMQQRWSLLREVMDSADALELQLTRVRRQLDGIASADHADAALREVLHDLLRQRMWLQQHGMDARIAELETVRSHLDAGRRRLDAQTTA